MFIAVIYIIFVCGIMYYGTIAMYDHYVRPFKEISEKNKTRKKLKLIDERYDIIINDDEFKRRIKPANDALKEGKIDNKRYEEIALELVKERNRELYDDYQDIFDINID